MISKEAVNKMIQEQLSEKLAGNKMSASQPMGELKEAVKEMEAVEVPSPDPIVKPLDEIDVIRLNNLLLKRRVEALNREIEDGRRATADADDLKDNISLQEFLINKYEIDTSIHKLQIDPQARTLTLSPI